MSLETTFEDLKVRQRDNVLQKIVPNKAKQRLDYSIDHLSGELYRGTKELMMQNEMYMYLENQQNGLSSSVRYGSADPWTYFNTTTANSKSIRSFAFSQ